LKQQPVRAEGLDMPARAHTMISVKRLADVRACVEDVLADGVPGDLVEIGRSRAYALALIDLPRSCMSDSTISGM
jgi:hypothetical protein